jgi:hypothetical protein
MKRDNRNIRWSLGYVAQMDDIEGVWEGWHLL